MSVSALYYFTPVLFGYEPFDFQELILWFDKTSESIKSAILSSIITVLGFLIAYATATANWKSQLLAQIKLEAAGEIEKLFAEASDLATELCIYAESLVESVDKIQKGCSESEAEFSVQYQRERALELKEKRERFCDLSVNVHDLSGKYSNLLMSTPGVTSEFEAAKSALKNINEKVWFNFPVYIANDPNPIQSFVNQVNIQDCMNYVSVVNANQTELGFSAGSIRGNFMSTVVGFNFWTLFSLFANHRQFYGAMKSRYIKLQSRG